jgi:hypothetical protein
MLSPQVVKAVNVLIERIPELDTETNVMAKQLAFVRGEHLAAKCSSCSAPLGVLSRVWCDLHLCRQPCFFVKQRGHWKRR